MNLRISGMKRQFLRNIYQFASHMKQRTHCDINIVAGTCLIYLTFSMSRNTFMSLMAVCGQRVYIHVHIGVCFLLLLRIR
jgi:hypothetical protein